MTLTEREAFRGLQSLPGPCPECGKERFGTERCKNCGFQELDDPNWPYEQWCPICESLMKQSKRKLRCPKCGHEEKVGGEKDEK